MLASVFTPGDDLQEEIGQTCVFMSVLRRVGLQCGPGIIHSRELQAAKEIMEVIVHMGSDAARQFDRRVGGLVGFS